MSAKVAVNEGGGFAPPIPPTKFHLLEMCVDHSSCIVFCYHANVLIASTHFLNAILVAWKWQPPSMFSMRGLFTIRCEKSKALSALFFLSTDDENVNFKCGKFVNASKNGYFLLVLHDK